MRTTGVVLHLHDLHVLLAGSYNSQCGAQLEPEHKVDGVMFTRTNHPVR